MFTILQRVKPATPDTLASAAKWERCSDEGCGAQPAVLRGLSTVNDGRHGNPFLFPSCTFLTPAR